MTSHTQDPSLSFVAPCRILTPSAPWHWIRLGWIDLRAAPVQSLSYGAGVALLSAVVLGVGIRYGTGWTVLMLLSGFVFIAPGLVMGLYTISSALSAGQRPSLRACLRLTRHALADALVYSLILMVICLLWIRAGSAVEIFFPEESEPSRATLLAFLAIGSATGSVFALVAFAASAFSLPMIADRRVDAVTAVVTSINAVLRNRRAMAVWVALIVLSVVVGVALAVVGLAVTMPLIAHSTWHGYRETIDSASWPRRE